MNLTKLFETQAALDEHIMQEHPELQGQNNLDWKLLALQVELGECANEWRGFKKWSKDQEPRTKVKVECWICNGTGDENYEFVQEDAEGTGNHEYIKCEDCDGTGYNGYKNPLLEEYVDCLHFVLSIGLEAKVNVTLELDIIKETNIKTLELFGIMFEDINKLGETTWVDTWSELFETFYLLGKSLGFTWEQVEESYYEKNKINHLRQENGY
ncbi:dUTP diphosphatase [Lysinibacillus fusiformis]|uniref:dUTP diphosphatase n=1 Tax=Lysinibacillus fusiformis TaxID=28031 RepID=UPI003D01F8A0